MKANNKIVTAVTGTRVEFFDLYLELSKELQRKYYYKFRSILGSDEPFDRILFTPSEWREIDQDVYRSPLPVTAPEEEPHLFPCCTYSVTHPGEHAPFCPNFPSYPSSLPGTMDYEEPAADPLPTQVPKTVDPWEEVVGPMLVEVPS